MPVDSSVRPGLVSLVLLALSASCAGATPRAVQTDDADGTQTEPGTSPAPRLDAASNPMTPAPVTPAPTDQPDAKVVVTGKDVDAAMRAPDAVAAFDATPAATTPLPPAVDCKKAKLCDDFEAYPVGAAPGSNWRVSGSANGLVVDSTRAYSGAKSILIKLPGTANIQAFMVPTVAGLFPLKDNVMYGRMMVFMPTSPGPGDRHWDMVIASGKIPTGETGNYMFGGYTEKFWPSYQPHHCWKDSKSPFIFGKWFCMQWQFDGAQGAGGTRNNQMRFWIDSVEHTDITVDHFGSGCTTGKWEWVAPNFDTVRLGFTQYQTSVAPIELSIDDVAISDAPIACPAPKP